MEEARRSGAGVLDRIQEHAEPYFRKYSDPGVVLKALLNNDEEVRWLVDNPYKRTLTTVALAASLGNDHQLSDAIEKMRGFLQKKDPNGVRGFELFTEKLRGLTGSS